MAVKRFYEIFHPEHYDLRINVNRKNKEINGTSTITGDVIESPVFINQKFMTIDSVKVDGKDVDFEVVEKDEAIKIETGVTGRAVEKVRDDVVKDPAHVVEPYEGEGIEEDGSAGPGHIGGILSNERQKR